MAEKIFSGKSSNLFWRHISKTKGKTHDVLYEYGCKAQEQEAELPALREENKILKNRIELLKKSKCPKCGYVFGIAKLSRSKELKNGR